MSRKILYRAKTIKDKEWVQGASCHLCMNYHKKYALKQFAEMLKEKFNRQEKRFADNLNRFENDLDKVKESDLPTAKFLIGKATGQATMAEKAQYYIDETLKECLCDNNQ